MPGMTLTVTGMPSNAAKLLTLHAALQAKLQELLSRNDRVAEEVARERETVARVRAQRGSLGARARAARGASANANGPLMDEEDAALRVLRANVEELERRVEEAVRKEDEDRAPHSGLESRRVAQILDACAAFVAQHIVASTPLAPERRAAAQNQLNALNHEVARERAATADVLARVRALETELATHENRLGQARAARAQAMADARRRRDQKPPSATAPPARVPATKQARVDKPRSKPASASASASASVSAEIEAATFAALQDEDTAAAIAAADAAEADAHERRRLQAEIAAAAQAEAEADDARRRRSRHAPAVAERVVEVPPDLWGFDVTAAFRARQQRQGHAR